MRVKNGHVVALELLSDFPVGAILEPIFRGNVDQKPLVLKHSQLVFVN